MYDEHGKYSISMDGGIFYSKFEGAFNDIASKSWCERAKRVIESFGNRKFLMLVNLLELEGGTPGAWDDADRFNKWLNQKNMIAKALVITSSMTKEIERARVPSSRTQNIRYFENERNATTWLLSQSTLQGE